MMECPIINMVDEKCIPSIENAGMAKAYDHATI
jgi:hypothetical protein